MNKIIQLGNLRKDSEGFTNPQTGRVYSKDGIAPTINTCQGGDRQPKVLLETAVKDDKDTTKTRKDCLEMTDKIEPTVKADEENGKEARPRIRRLTPRECWRLMDFTDEDFDRAKWYSKEESIALLEKYPNHKGKRQFTEEERIERISDSQLCKQAGNSICVGVLYYIYKELYEAMPYLFDDLKVSSYFSGIGAFESALDRLYEDINSEGDMASACADDKPTGKKEIIVYDDYNSNVRADQDTIGTLTTNIGATALRNSYKNIEK